VSVLHLRIGYFLFLDAELHSSAELVIVFTPSRSGGNIDFDDAKKPLLLAVGLRVVLRRGVLIGEGRVDGFTRFLDTEDRETMAEMLDVPGTFEYDDVLDVDLNVLDDDLDVADDDLDVLRPRSVLVVVAKEDTVFDDPSDLILPWNPGVFST